jgi:hypothetical protein
VLSAQRPRVKSVATVAPLGVTAPATRPLPVHVLYVAPPCRDCEAVISRPPTFRPDDYLIVGDAVLVGRAPRSVAWRLWCAIGTDFILMGLMEHGARSDRHLD